MLVARARAQGQVEDIIQEHYVKYEPLSVIRVLHVDDEPNQLKYAKLFIEKWDLSIKVESVTSSEEALHLLQERSYDCIVSDYLMPRLDGIELARRVRETSNVPFVIYTGQGSEEVAEAAFAAGVDDYLRKELDPSHYQVLAKRIRTVVEKHRARARAQSLHLHATELNKAETPDEVFNITYKAMDKTLGFEALDVIKVENGILRDVFLKNPQRGPFELPINGPGVTVRAARTGEPQYVPDVTQYPDYVQGRTGGMASEYAVPVMVEGEAVAVLNVESHQVDAFTNRDRELLETLAFHMASAFTRLRKLSERREYEERLEALHRHATELGRAETLGKIGEITFEAIEGVLGFSQGGFGVVEGSHLRFIHVLGAEFDEAFEMPLDGPGITIRAVKTGKTQLVPDIRLDEDFVEGPAGRELGSLSELAIPVRIGAKVVAVINVESSKLAAFTEDDRRLLKIFSEHVASAIRSLREQVEQQKYEARLEALHSHATDLGYAESIDDVVMSTFKTIEQTLGFGRGALGIVRDGFLHFKNIGGHQYEDYPLDGRGITVRAVRTGETQLVPNIREDPDFITGQPDGEPTSLSELDVPVKAGSRTLGVVNIESTYLDAFSEEDRRLTEIFANHVASAMERLRNEEDRRRYERRLEALHRHATELSRAETIEEIGATTFHAIEVILRLSRGSFCVVESGLLRFIHLRNFETAEYFELPLDGPGVTVRAVKTGKTQLVPDTRLDKDFIKGVAEETLESLSELAVPIIVDGKVEAVINLEKQMVDAFTEEDQILLEILARHIASAIKHLRQVKSLFKQEDRLAALHDSATQLTQTNTRKDITDVTLNAMRRSLGFEVASFLMVENGHLVTVALEGAEMKGLKLPIDGPGITVKVARLGRTINVPNTRSETDFVEGAIHALSELAVPVKVRGNVRAVLNVESIRLNAYDDNDQRLLETLAIHVASALDRLEQIESLEIRVEEKTRELLDAERMVTAGRIASMVGHDLRGPLQTIKNALYLMGKKSDEPYEYLKMADTAVDRAAKLLEELRHRTRDSPPNIVKTDLSELIYNAVNEVQIPGSIDVTLELDDGLKAVSLDSLKMRRVLDNLISNAVDAMPKGGSIVVSAKRMDDDVHIEIKDTGVGIPKNEMQNLFKPFHTTKESGIGLGLAYCKRAVEAHGGTITVESEGGKGTTFTVELPCVHTNEGE